MRREWDEEKQRILDALVGADEELEIPAEREVCIVVYQLYVMQLYCIKNYLFELLIYKYL